MRRSARTVLCGGRSVMIVPTASLQTFAQPSALFFVDRNKTWCYYLSHDSRCASCISCGCYFLDCLCSDHPGSD
jgi:hypothetical protein